MSRTALTSQRYIPAPEGDDAERLRAAASRAAASREAKEAAELKKTKRVIEIDAPAKFDAGAGFMAGFALGWIVGIILLVMPGLHSLLAHTSPLIGGLYGAGVGSMIGMVIGGAIDSVRIFAAHPAEGKRTRRRYLVGRGSGRIWGAKSSGVSQTSRLSEIRLGMAHESLQNSLNDFFASGTSLASAHVKVPVSISESMADHKARSLPVIPLSLVLRPAQHANAAVELKARHASSAVARQGSAKQAA